MFEKGEFIVYGSTGVCEVADITTISHDTAIASGISKNKLYYVLHPYNQNGGRIFTPVDNVKTVMRRIVSQEEVEQILRNLQKIEDLWVDDERQREQKYKEAYRSCDCRKWISIIKTCNLHKAELKQRGKKLSAADRKYSKLAEESLFTEFSIPLDIPKEEVKEYIESYVEK